MKRVAWTVVAGVAGFALSGMVDLCVGQPIQMRANIIAGLISAGIYQVICIIVERDE